jgi:hypothetical protein
VNEHEQWSQLGQRVRVDSVRAAAAAGSGHPASSMSAADLMAVLLAKYLRYDFDRPAELLNDHLIFSKVMRPRGSTRSMRRQVRSRTPSCCCSGNSEAGPRVTRRRGSEPRAPKVPEMVNAFNQSRREARVAVGEFTRMGGRFP